MRLAVLGSSSRGNGYVLQNDTEALVIECGCSVSDCIRVLGYNVKKVSGVIVTHEHGDHAKFIEKYLERFHVFCSHGTASAIRYKGKRRPNELEPFIWTKMGNFEIYPFDTQHDCSQPFGYVVRHPEIGTMLFATDTYYVKYNFSELGLTNMMIECNYDEELLEDNVRNGIVPPFLRDRTIRSHMSVDNCIDLLRANDIKRVSQIVLIHLSTHNSDAERFRKQVSLAVGKKVVIAKKGLDIPFNETPL